MDSKSLLTDDWARGHLTKAGWANQIILRKGLRDTRKQSWKPSHVNGRACQKRQAPQNTTEVPKICSDPSPLRCLMVYLTFVSSEIFRLSSSNISFFG